MQQFCDLVRGKVAERIGNSIHGALSPSRRGFFFAFFAERTSALFAAALRATADRSSKVMVTMRRIPPFLPPLRPISRMTSEIVFLFIFISLSGFAKSVNKTLD